MSDPSYSIVIATYRRESVLIETIEALLRLAPSADEILVVDQSEQHEPRVAAALADFASEGRIRHLRLVAPNIPAAMNEGLRSARAGFVLFLDDDIRPAPNLVAAHCAARAATGALLIAGRVVQPWHKADAPALPQTPVGRRAGFVDEFFGGNFSIDRRAALALGGFDENFARAAYRFEAEFAHRWRRSSQRIYYAPEAALFHLKVPTGGTRAFGDHLRTVKPDHAVGEYYCLLRTASGWRTLRDFLRRPIKAIATRHHLAAPWWIPLTLIGEARAMVWAITLALRGPRLSRS